MITIYHIEARRSERVAWLLEELGIPYQLEFKLGDVGGSLEYLKTSGHPLAMAPVVIDQGNLLIESGAILETLLNRYGDGRLRPAINSPQHAAYLEWMHFAEGTAMARFTLESVQRNLPPYKNPAMEARRVGRSAEILRYVDAVLGKTPYFAGDEFTAADIMMHFPLRIGASIAAERTGYPAALLQPNAQCLKPYPQVKAWLERVQDRAAFQRMLATTMPKGWPKM